MKIFITWSGPRSKPVATELKSWIKEVLQATEPWVSTKDIEPGTAWFNKITTQLKDSDVGIVCLTPENLDEPWVNFEAGAIAKNIDTSRACTLLIGLNNAEVAGPLANFQHTPANNEGLRVLLKSFNEKLPKPLGEKSFNRVFDRLWPDIEPVIQKALEKTTAMRRRSGNQKI